ncbi:MAG: histidine kinase [Bacillota bacterium]|nr:histidine kinase [Bacillota bacterium]
MKWLVDGAIPGRVLWPAVLLPALMAGGFEFVRHGLPFFEAMPTPLGNLATASLALVGSLFYLRYVFRLVTRLVGQAEAERAARLALEQRESVAAELHDRVLQTLFFLGVALRHLRQKVPSDLAAEVDDVLASLDEVDAEVRRTIDRLRQAEAERAGAKATDLRRLAEEMLLGSGIALRSERPLPASLPLEPAAGEALVAIVREALVNARKHARARTVRMAWEEDGEGRFLLRIADDGAGFDPASSGGGLGLALMRRRAAEAGFQLELESAPGRGTTLAIRGRVAAARRLAEVARGA